MNEKIRDLWIKNQYNSEDTLKQLRNLSEENINDYEYKKDDFNKNYISIVDKYYPPLLNRVENIPMCLFYAGNIEILNNRKCIGIIGARNNTEYGDRVVEEIIKRLNNDLVIVSGLAKGIDGLAHKYAIKYGLHTIGVIGSGLKYVYPKCNNELFNLMKQNELIISEYDYFEPIEKHHFVSRNRIIAGISDILIVVESQVKSGTHLTVNNMLDMGKEVYVVPHNLFNLQGGGNNLLIQEGANIIYDLDEFCLNLNKIV